MQTRIGFVTCVELGKGCVEEILNMGGRLELLMTLKDELAINKSGRIYLDDIASKNNIPLKKIRHINDQESVEIIRAANLDWLFIIGWSQIASSDVLAAVKKRVLGMHPTLLPKGRGRAAIPWAILEDLQQTGVTLFALDSGVDSGPIADQITVTVRERETAATLYPRIIHAHRELIRKVWSRLINGEIQLYPQNELEATTWAGRSPKDGEIKSGMTVEQVDRLVRATTRPYPGAFYKTGDGELITIWAGRPGNPVMGGKSIVIQCADGEYIATECEPRER